MTATSVTGIGRGSADGMTKGSEHMSLGVNHLVGPRVVASGRGASAAPSLTFVVELPGVAGDAATHNAMVTQQTGAAVAATAALTDGPNGLVLTVTTVAPNVNTWQWMVVKNGV